MLAFHHFLKKALRLNTIVLRKVNFIIHWNIRKCPSHFLFWIQKPYKFICALKCLHFHQNLIRWNKFMTYQDINDILHFNWGLSTTLSFKTSDLKIARTRKNNIVRKKIKVSVERFIKKSKMKQIFHYTRN